jgi:hypothetical protein
MTLRVGFEARSAVLWKMVQQIREHGIGLNGDPMRSNVLDASPQFAIRLNRSG